MAPTMTYIRATLLPILATTLAVTGCGDGAEQNTKPIERGVVTSALECADIYSLDIAKCQKAIRTAISDHEKNSPKYNRLHKCEETEGPQRCERAGQKDFSRRLQAFLLGVKDPPIAAPLYATTGGEVGFVRSSGDVILADQDEIKFSEQAQVIADNNGELPKK